MELFTWARLQWDRVLALLAGIAGTGFLVVGWIGVSGTPYIAKQVPYVVSGGLGGLALLIAGATLWLSADMNDEWRVLDRIELDAREHDEVQDDDLALLRERVQALEVLLAQNGDPTKALREQNGHGRRTRAGSVA
jgi:hypothetical protein